MPRTAADVPADSSILCEGCGYTLDGLPLDGNCPECGKPVAESTAGDGRQPPNWESTVHRKDSAFFQTTWRVIVAPSRFFRHLTTRTQTKEANLFAQIHWSIASLFLALAAIEHWNWYVSYLTPGERMTSGEKILLLGASYFALWGTTVLAARLTSWEARYRGIRLPRPVVRRGLNYHAAHYLPVGFLAWVTTAYYRHLLAAQSLALDSANVYLCLLSAEVVVAAIYLFWTYWAAMRNMMYANR